jgi:hypothetical protein
MDYKEMSYEDIEKEVDRLLTINPDDLDGEAIRGPKIFTSLNRIYIQKSRQLSELMKALHKLEFKRQRYYAGKETSEVYRKEPLVEAVLKTDIPNYMNVDPLVTEMRELVKESERIVKFLEDAKGQLRQRGFDIKNALDFRRMMLGL